MEPGSPIGTALCPNHPGVVAGHDCRRCGRAFCSECVAPLRGRDYCGSCRARLLSGVFGGRPVSAPSTAGPGVPAQEAVPARCGRHAERVPSAVCERCGDFMCSACVTPIDGRAYCPSCFDLLWQRGGFGYSRGRFTPGRSALIGAVAACPLLFVLPILGTLLAVGALVTAGTTLWQAQRAPDLPGRVEALVAVAVVLAGLTGVAGVWILHRLQ